MQTEHAQTIGRRPAKAVSLESIWALSPRAIWFGFWAQPAAFIFLCTYFFFEYTRIQTIYSVINVISYPTVFILFTFIAWPNSADWSGLKSPMTWLVGAFWIVLLASWSFVLGSANAGDEIYLFFNWLIVYILTVTLVNNRVRFFLFLLLFFLWNLKMSQHGAVTWIQRGFSYAGWGVSGPSGWFQNSGEFGAQMVMFAAMSWGFWRGARDYMSPLFRRLFLIGPVSAAMSVIASNSRGDLLAGVAAVAWLTVFSERIRVKPLLLGALVLVGGYYALPEGTLDRFQTAGEDDTSVSRLIRWEAGIEITNDFPLLGLGPDQWMNYYPAHYPREPEREGWGIPHNMFIDASAELGYSGLTVFVLMLLWNFRETARARKAAREMDDTVMLWTARGMDGATVGFMVAGFFMSVLNYPFLWVQVATCVAMRHCAEKALIEHRASAGNTEKGAGRLAARTTRRLSQAHPATPGGGPPGSP